MNTEYLTVSVTTPQKKWVFNEVISCTAPGINGSFQILFNHAPLMSQLEIGEIKLGINKGVERYSTSGGFLEVLKNNVSLLLESCEKAEEIDVERAKSALERARKRLQEKSAEVDLARVEAALLRALNRIRIAGKVQ
jgi:F-type H+-transporting ATPase subunit epsilon